MIRPSVALDTGQDGHHLDHIAPLASLLNIPLIVTSEANFELSRKYYPEVMVRLYSDIGYRYRELCEEFDCFFDCSFWALPSKELLRVCCQKKMQIIYCPHGQSDKGYGACLLSPYADQDAVLLYGKLHQEMLRELEIWDQIQSYAIVGNYRQLYHLQHFARLEKLAHEAIFSKLQMGNPTLLYAPTWQDADKSSSFFSHSAKVLQDLPSSWNLILKVHPLLPEKDPAEYYRIREIQETRVNFILVEQFPLIYPILDKITAYLGDYSSIGYDALAFFKPMFFLSNANQPPARLHSCGNVLNPDQNFFQQIEKGLINSQQFSKGQQALCKRAFTKVDNLKQSLTKLFQED